MKATDTDHYRREIRDVAKSIRMRRLCLPGREGARAFDQEGQRQRKRSGQLLISAIG